MEGGQKSCSIFCRDLNSKVFRGGKNVELKKNYLDRPSWGGPGGTRAAGETAAHWSNFWSRQSSKNACVCSAAVGVDSWNSLGMLKSNGTASEEAPGRLRRSTGRSVNTALGGRRCAHHHPCRHATAPAQPCSTAMASRPCCALAGTPGDACGGRRRLPGPPCDQLIGRILKTA